MKKEILNAYSINILNLLLVSFITEIIFTIVANYPNRDSQFTGITIWLILAFYLVIIVLKKIKTHENKFFLNFFICLVIIFLIRSHINFFNFIRPNYFGFNGHLFKYFPKTEDYDVKKFLFWQTGMCSNYNLIDYRINSLLAFFIVPPVAIFKCILKSIFPNLFILFLIQTPFLILNQKYILWTK